MKATEQYFPVVLFIMLYKVVLTSESVDEMLKCDHQNETYWPVKKIKQKQEYENDFDIDIDMLFVTRRVQYCLVHSFHKQKQDP